MGDYPKGPSSIMNGPALFPDTPEVTGHLVEGQLHFRLDLVLNYF